MRFAYLIAGLAFIILAVIGALLPLMPSTIFLILAAGAFARSSPRLEGWLLDHPRLGPPIRRWRESGAISAGAKRLAFAWMASGYAIYLFGARPAAPYATLVAVVLAASAIYVATRPNE